LTVDRLTLILDLLTSKTDPRVTREMSV